MPYAIRDPLSRCRQEALCVPEDGPARTGPEPGRKSGGMTRQTEEDYIMNNEDVTALMREIGQLELIGSDRYGEYAARARRATERLSALVPMEVAPAANADDPMEVAARLDTLWRGLAARHEWHDAQVVNMALSDLTEVVH